MIQVPNEYARHLTESDWWELDSIWRRSDPAGRREIRSMLDRLLAHPPRTGRDRSIMVYHLMDDARALLPKSSTAKFVQAGAEVVEAAIGYLMGRTAEDELEPHRAWATALIEGPSLEWSSLEARILSIVFPRCGDKPMSLDRIAKNLGIEGDRCIRILIDLLDRIKNPTEPGQAQPACEGERLGGFAPCSAVPGGSDTGVPAVPGRFARHFMPREWQEVVSILANVHPSDRRVVRELVDAVVQGDPEPDADDREAVALMLDYARSLVALAEDIPVSDDEARAASESVEFLLGREEGPDEFRNQRGSRLKKGK